MLRRCCKCADHLGQALACRFWFCGGRRRLSPDKWSQLRTDGMKGLVLAKQNADFRFIAEPCLLNTVNMLGIQTMTMKQTIRNLGPRGSILPCSEGNYSGAGKCSEQNALTSQSSNWYLADQPPLCFHALTKHLPTHEVREDGMEVCNALLKKRLRFFR